MQVRCIAPAVTPFPESEQASFPSMMLISYIILGARSLINHMP